MTGGRTGAILLAVVAALVLYVGARILGSGPEPVRREGPGSVEKSVPPGTRVEEAGALADSAAAARLLVLLDRHPEAPRLALAYTRGGVQVHLLADREQDLVERWSRGSGNTLVDTVWPGGVRARLAWAAEHGDFEAPDLPPGRSRNLYH